MHRDLKPSNVLLTADGPPKIADFGLAKRLQSEAGQTQVGIVVGTPSYMAPEQALGLNATIGPPADVFALGAILYEMLVGRPPFVAETPLETLIQVKTLDPVPPRRLQPRLAQDLETICLTCLHKAPAKRYATAEALADDLHRFLSGEPIQARPVGRFERLGRWCRRNPALAGASGLAAAALAGAIAVSILFAIHQSRAATVIAQKADNLEEERDQTKKALEEATRQRTKADDVSDRLRQEKQQTETALHKTQRLTAILTFEKALLFCEHGDIPRGLLYLARSLKETPADDQNLQRVIRANLDGWRRHLLPLKECLEHRNEVWAVAFGPDGTVLTGSKGGVAKFWDAKTGTSSWQVPPNGELMTRLFPVEKKFRNFGEPMPFSCVLGYVRRNELEKTEFPGRSTQTD